jgi:hypothetical protein
VKNFENLLANGDKKDFTTINFKTLRKKYLTTYFIRTILSVMIDCYLSATRQYCIKSSNYETVSIRVVRKPEVFASQAWLGQIPLKTAKCIAFCGTCKLSEVKPITKRAIEQVHLLRSAQFAEYSR